MTDPASGSGPDRGRAARFAFVGIVAFSVLVVVLHVGDYTRVSPSDELQHYDYLVRVVRDHEIVRRGDFFSEEALRTEACQGLDADFPVPPCGQPHYRARDFQEGGYNTAYIHQPVYYAASGAAAWLAAEVVGSDSLFTTGRLTGAVWLAAAVVLLWLSMAELAVPRWARAVALALVVTAPTVLEATGTVNPDATALLAGAAVLYAVLRWERGGRWVVPAIAATLAVALKSTNIMGLGVGVLYVVIRHVQRSREQRTPVFDRAGLRRPLLVLGGMLVGAATVAVAWVGYSSAVARVPTEAIPMAARFHAESIGVADILRNLTTGFTPFDTPYVPAELSTAWIGPAAVVVDRLFLVGLAIAGVLAVRGSRVRALVYATVVALALVGPGFVVANFVLQGTYVDIPRRYGLSVVPAMAVAVSTLLADRRWLSVIAPVAALIGLGTVRTLIG